MIISTFEELDFKRKDDFRLWLVVGHQELKLVP